MQKKLVLTSAAVIVICMFAGCGDQPINMNDGTLTITNNVLMECNTTTSGELVIPDGVTYISSSAFSDCESLTSVTIPDSVIRIGYCAFEGCSSLTNVSIPDSVSSIDEWAFDKCENITVTYKNKTYTKDNIDELYN